MKDFLEFLSNNSGLLAFIALILTIVGFPIFQEPLGKMLVRLRNRKYRNAEELYQDYKKRLLVQLNSFPYWGNAQDEPSLRKYYIPINLMPVVHPDKIARTKGGNPDISSIQQILADKSKRRVILLGEPGSGKTTLLKNTALTLLENSSGMLQLDILPVFIRVKELMANPDADIYEELIRKLKGDDETELSQAIMKAITVKLEKGLFIFFLDGLDEIGEERYPVAVDNINRSMRDNNFDKCRFFISCRTQIYQPSSVRANIEVETREFEEDDVRDFLDRFNWDDYPNKSGRMLYLLLHSKNNLINNCRNPLRLSIVVSLYRQGSDLPESERDLYDEFCKVLISTREFTWQGKQLTYDIIKPVFGDLALNKYLQSGDFKIYSQFTIEDLKNTIRNNRNLKGEKVLQESPELSVGELANQICQRSSLVVRRSKDNYEFSHLSFHEFFVSEKISLEGSGTQLLISELQKDRTKWLHPLMLYANSISSLNPALDLIESLHSTGASETAGLCLGNLQPDLRTGIPTAKIIPIIDTLKNKLDQIFINKDRDPLESELKGIFASLSAIAAQNDTDWGRTAFRVINSYIDAGNETVASYAITALGRIRSSDTIKILKNLLMDPEIRPVVEKSLVKIGSDCNEAVGNILNSSEDVELCESAINILESIGSIGAMEVLAETFYHKMKPVSIRAVYAFCRLFKRKDTQRVIQSVRLPSSIEADEVLQNSIELADVWPFDSKIGPVHYLVAKASSLLAESTEDPYEPNFIHSLDSLDRRMIVAMAMKIDPKFYKTLRKKETQARVRPFISNMKSQPTCGKLFLIVLSSMKRLGLEGVKRNWKEIHGDYEKVQGRSKNPFYIAAGIFRFLATDVGAIISGIVSLILLIFRAFGSSPFSKSYGLLSWWELLVLPLLCFLVIAALAASSPFLLYREYEKKENDIGYSLNKFLVRYPRIYSVCVYLLMGCYFAIVILLSGLLWGIWLGMPMGMLIPLTTFLYFGLTIQLRRDAFMRKINPLCELVMFNYLDQGEIKIAN